MIYGLNRLKQKNLNSIYDAVEKLVEIAEAQNIKATFFFDKE